MCMQQVSVSVCLRHSPAECLQRAGWLLTNSWQVPGNQGSQVNDLTGDAEVVLTRSGLRHRDCCWSRETTAETQSSALTCGGVAEHSSITVAPSLLSAPALPPADL